MKQTRGIIIVGTVITLAFVMAACQLLGPSTSTPFPPFMPFTKTPGGSTAVAQLTVSLPELVSSPTPTPPQAVLATSQSLHIDATSVPIFGMQMGNVSVEHGLDQVVDSRAYWVRLGGGGLPWAVVEPNKGDRNWEAILGVETQFLNSAYSGLETIVTIANTPPWAQNISGYSCGPVKSDALEAFADFMYDVVARYSQPPYNVKYWELWNEPDIDPAFVAPDSPWGCWGDKDAQYYGGEYYAEMLKLAYPKIKAADPEAQVLVGGLMLDCDPTDPPETAPDSGEYKDCSPALFLEGILRNGGGNYFDGISFHAYDYYYGEQGLYGNPSWHSDSKTTGPGLIAKSRYLRALLAKYMQPNKDLYNTEVAVLCGHSGQEPGCIDSDFNNTKSYYLVQAYTAALFENLRANVWYSLKGWRASGLVDNTLNPYPVYDAFQFSAEQLSEAKPERIITTLTGLRCYEFSRGESRLWVLWAFDGDTHSIELPFSPDEIYDVYGEKLQIDQVLTVTLAPLYITWIP